MSLTLNAYEQARSYLTARLDFERRPNARPYTSTHYSLDGFVALLERMGSPHRNYPSIHIAGTKGKGSTAAMLESALRAAGLSTGLYTSPHLRDYPERIRLNGTPISPEEFTRAMNFLAPIVESDGFHRGDPSPYRTVFELITALAFDVFSHHSVDMAVLETGLGGRLDCTNVVQPEAAVITVLGLDHIALLGNTIEKIAWEKGGVIKEGVPVVVGVQTPEGQKEGIPVLERLAAEKQSPLLHAASVIDVQCLGGNDFEQIVRLIQSNSASSLCWAASRPEGKTFSGKICTDEGYDCAGLDSIDSIAPIRLPFVGDHQLENLRTAATTWEVLRRRGWKLSWKAFAQGIEQCRWPGRIEIIPTRPRIIVDGAHCILSVKALVRTLANLYPGAKRRLVFGVQRDKDYLEMMRILGYGEANGDPQTHSTSIDSMSMSHVPGAGKPSTDLYTNGIPNVRSRSVSPIDSRKEAVSWDVYEVPGGRGASASDLAQAAAVLGFPPDSIRAHSSPAEAFQSALSRAQSDELVVTCGTLYTVAEMSDLARAHRIMSATENVL